MKVLSLFSGIGAFEKALDNLAIPYELVAFCEVDKYAAKSYSAIHNVPESMNLGDITKVDETKLPKDIDLLTYGFPCQDISIAGKQKGLINEDGSQTRSGLFFEALRIIEATHPKIAIAENVKNLVGKKFNAQFQVVLASLESAGYNNYYKVLNAKDFGIPQNRERVFIVSIRKDIDTGKFEFPKPFPLEKRLKDVLEEVVDEKYYLSGKMLSFIEGLRDEKASKDTLKQVGQMYPNSGNPQAGRIYDADGISPTMDTCSGGNRMPKVAVAMRGRYNQDGEVEQHIEVSDRECANAITTVQKDSLVGETMFTETQAQMFTPEGDVKRYIGSDQEGQTPRQRKDIKHIEKYCEYCGAKLERKRFNGRLEDFTVFNNRKYCNRGCMRKGFLKIGKGDQSYSSAHTTARRINELILQKEFCELCGGTQNLDIHHIDGDWQNNQLENLMCLCRSCHTKHERNKGKPVEMRIRKLTPLETWRLMGFDDESFHRAEAINSNSQLYKQAGNSIVVDVLECLLCMMIDGNGDFYV